MNEKPVLDTKNSKIEKTILSVIIEKLDFLWKHETVQIYIFYSNMPSLNFVRNTFLYP